jgi:hypothetical protein
MRTADIPKLHETIAAREAEFDKCRRDVAMLEYTFFELEKKEDAPSPRCRRYGRGLLRSRRVYVRLPEMGYVTDVLVQNFSSGRKSLMPTRARSKRGGSPPITRPLTLYGSESKKSSHLLEVERVTLQKAEKRTRELRSDRARLEGLREQAAQSRRLSSLEC